MSSTNNNITSDTVKLDLQKFFEDIEDNGAKLSNKKTFSFIGLFLEYCKNADPVNIKPQNINEMKSAFPVINTICKIFEDYKNDMDACRDNLYDNIENGNQTNSATIKKNLNQLEYDCNKKIEELNIKIKNLTIENFDLKKKLESQPKPQPAPSVNNAQTQSQPQPQPKPQPQPQAKAQQKYTPAQYLPEEIAAINVTTDQKKLSDLNRDINKRTKIKKLIITGSGDCFPGIYDFNNLEEIEISHGIVQLSTNMITKCPKLKVIKINENCVVEYEYKMPFSNDSAPEFIIGKQGSKAEAVAKICKINFENIN